MRITKTFAILAPAALALTACGGSEAEVEEVGTETTEVAVDDNAMPAVPADARGTLDYAGTYEQLGEDGRKQSLMLNADDTYTMMHTDGSETTGTFNWYDDNTRILIKEEGENQVYAVGDGAIYRLADADAAFDTEMTKDQMWRKAIRL